MDLKSLATRKVLSADIKGYQIRNIKLWDPGRQCSAVATKVKNFEKKTNFLTEN